MGSGKIMLATEFLVAMLAFEREEVNKAAVLGGTLVPDCEESTRLFGGCGHGCSVGIRVRCALVCLYTPWPMWTRKPLPSLPQRMGKSAIGYDYVSR